MPTDFANAILDVFDIDENSHEFLAEILTSKRTPEYEKRKLFEISLMAGHDDWNWTVDCINALLQSPTRTYRGVSSHRSSPRAKNSVANPWAGTDHLIQLILTAWNCDALGTQSYRAQSVARGKATFRSSPHGKGKPQVKTSHYWGTPPEAMDPVDSSTQCHGGDDSSWKRKSLGHIVSESVPSNNKRPRIATKPYPLTQSQALTEAGSRLRNKENIPIDTVNATGEHPGPDRPALQQSTTPHQHVPRLMPNSTGERGGKRRPIISPFFNNPPQITPRQALRRPARGTVSSLPFPPLSAPRFGLIQESLAHNPFRLLIAVTFLIRTAGKTAIPVFYHVMQRFPSYAHLADPANTAQLTVMIRHLGLSAVRVAAIQRYAKGWLTSPPVAGKRYRVRNYTKRDVELGCLLQDDDEQEFNGNTDNISAMGTSDPTEEDAEAWEIGHLTQGKYAIDSWRIFCRDELLARAADWNGKGREPEFQPEWMRVLPEDKELRAYLRWMWMREGWEWDPVTGERTVLREEMRRATEEGRVDYNDHGGLEIVRDDRLAREYG